MPVQNIDLYTSHGRTAVADTGGKGMPLLMLHGNGASMSAFRAQFESPISEVHRLIAIDLPGHGNSARSETPEIDYTITAISEQMAEVLALLGVERAFVLGWSLGGHIAVQMMHAYPDMLSGVMLAGTPPIKHGTIAMLRGFQARPEMLLGSKMKLTESEAERFAALVYGRDVSSDFVADIMNTDGCMRPNMARSLVRGDGGPNQRSIIADSMIPVAVVNGSKDPIVRLSCVENASYGNLWENTCHQIANAGHAPFLNASNTFNTLLHRFVTDVALKGRIAPAKDIPIERSA